MDELDQNIIDIYELLPHSYMMVGPFVSYYTVYKIVEAFDERFSDLEKLKITDAILTMAETDGFTVLPEEKFQELFGLVTDWAVKNNYAVITEQSQEHLTLGSVGDNVPPFPLHREEENIFTTQESC